MTQQVLLEEVNPNGNLQAVVEAAGGVVYFYLFGDPDSPNAMKSVWVRNLVPAPAELDVEAMRDGKPPLNPAPFCRHPRGLALPEVDDLHVCWLPEGNGVALYEKEELLAIIPPWSGVQGFTGYALDQIGEGALAWELEKDNVLFQRFRQAEEYWQAWEGEIWSSTQQRLLQEIETALGPHSNYYAIDGGSWPPKALVRIPRDEGTVLVTLGVSLRPQPNVELSTDNPQPLRRIELGAFLPSSWPEEEVMKFAGMMSGHSNHPWEFYTWLGPGHTIACPGWNNNEFAEALLLDEHPESGKLELSPVFDDPVTVLWYYPITAAEREVAAGIGSDRLIAQLPEGRWKNA